MNSLEETFDSLEAAALYRVRQERDEAREALQSVASTPCREWVNEKVDRCNAPAEFVLWGKLFPRAALGPRCYDHAAEHAGFRALGDPSWAIIDLRPALRVLEAASDA